MVSQGWQTYLPENSNEIDQIHKQQKRVYERKRLWLILVNQLQPGVAFLYPLKTSENKYASFLQFSGH